MILRPNNSVHVKKSLQVLNQNSTFTVTPNCSFDFIIKYDTTPTFFVHSLPSTTMIYSAMLLTTKAIKLQVVWQHSNRFT